VVERICENCSKRFKTYSCYVKRSGGRFCSKKCSSDGKFNGRYIGGLEKVWFDCLCCNKKFYAIKHDLHTWKPKFCSRKCAGKYNSEIYIGENARFWKGGIRNCHGYVNIYKPNHPFANIRGEVAEHRLVMEAKIGRYLEKNETIHHINHIKTDNQISNLLLLTKSEHGTLHGKMNKGIKKPGAIKNLIPYMKSKGWNIKKLEEKYG
jgi:hypothetical protein